MKEEIPSPPSLVQPLEVSSLRQLLQHYSDALWGQGPGYRGIAVIKKKVRKK